MNHMATSKENMRRTTVRKASELLVQCDVREPRSVLRYVKEWAHQTATQSQLINSLSSSWEFVTSDYDIGFGVYHVKENGEKVEVVSHVSITCTDISLSFL